MSAEPLKCTRCHCDIVQNIDEHHGMCVDCYIDLFDEVLNNAEIYGDDDCEPVVCCDICECNLYGEDEALSGICSQCEFWSNCLE